MTDVFDFLYLCVIDQKQLRMLGLCGNTGKGLGFDEEMEVDKGFTKKGEARRDVEDRGKHIERSNQKDISTQTLLFEA